jgi:RNA polymerase sigma-70 factor (ECF subfamily)
VDEPLVAQLSTVSPVNVRDFDSAFEGVRPTLVRICRAICDEEGEDVVQDVYVTGRRRISQLRDQASLGAWLTRIAINECYQRHRIRQRLGRIVPTLRQEAESDLDLRSNVQALPYRERAIVVLHYGYGLELNEVADLLDEKPSTIRSVLFRTRARLRSALREA